MKKYIELDRCELKCVCGEEITIAGESDLRAAVTEKCPNCGNDLFDAVDAAGVVEMLDQAEKFNAWANSLPEDVQAAMFGDSGDTVEVTAAFDSTTTLH